MVDVTILLYLPINTSLDDLAFVADWGQKIVGLAEEKMILNGKNTRYMRQRVMPMMYNPENNIRPVQKAKTRENTESWLKLLRKRDTEALPSWVKSHDLLNRTSSGSDNDDDHSQSSSGHGSHDHDSQLCDCKVNRKNYLDVIREAVQFTYPTQTVSEVSAAGSDRQLDSDNDSIFSDAVTDDDDQNEENLMGSTTSIEGLSVFSLGSNGSQNSRQNSEFSNKSKYSSYTNQASSIQQSNSVHSHNQYSVHTATSGRASVTSLERDIKNMNIKTTSQNSSSAISLGSQSDLNSFGSRTSTHTISTNKHVILSVAMGYDRDSMKEVRKVINETGVALLSVGIGDRGMIGLGGYYIKKLSEIKNLQNTIVNRLWNLV